MRDIFEQICAQVSEADNTIASAAKRKWDCVAKPIGSLGLLETALMRVCAAQRRLVPVLEPRAVAVFCADNGIICEGVTQTGSEVTAIVADNICKGQANINMMARCARCDVVAVDVGMCSPIANPALINCSSARGTANFAQGPAMTMDQLFNALNAGCMVSERLVRGGYSLLACGEMGIGNTSAASAVSAVLLDIDVEMVTGPGAGLNADGLRRKIAAVKQGIKINCPDRDNIYDVLSKVGSFDIAAMTGFMIACAAQNVPVIIDGCISAAAALCAVRLCPAVRSYLIASHVSDEPAGKLLLKELELDAPITAGMRLGEGTGAVAFMPLLDMAFAVYTQAASFESSGVIPYTTFGAVSQ